MLNWILGVIESGGYGGIFFLMVAENVFPPIPSEMILPLAGFAAAKGELNIILVILIATAGAVAGCLPWYVLGRVFHADRLKRLSARYGRLLALSPHDIDVAEGWSARHGQKAVVFGRLVPTVRTLISVPAGISRMPLTAFVLFSFIGSVLWTTILVMVGYVLGNQYGSVSDYVDSIAKVIVLLIIVAYVYKVVTFRADIPPSDSAMETTSET